jgi:hypothetical protein
MHSPLMHESPVGHCPLSQAQVALVGSQGAPPSAPPVPVVAPPVPVPPVPLLLVLVLVLLLDDAEAPPVDVPPVPPVTVAGRQP